MKKMKYIAITAILMVLYMMIEYEVRGYFAFGAEILFPIMTIGVYELIGKKGEDHEEDTL